MEILLWLAPAAVTTTLAMLVAGWAGRQRVVTPADQARAQERLGRAVLAERRAPVVTPSPTVSVARPAARPAASPAVRPAARAVDDVRRSA